MHPRILSVAPRLARVKTIADDELESVKAELDGKRFGSTSVHEAAAQLYEDIDGEAGVLVSITLSDPATDAWPIEDVRALRTAVRAIVGRLPHLGDRVFFELRPVSEEQLADDDAPLGDAG